MSTNSDLAPPSTDIPVDSLTLEPSTKKQKTGLVCWKCGGNHKSTDCPDFHKIEGWPFRPDNQERSGITILDASAYDFASVYLYGVAQMALQPSGFVYSVRTGSGSVLKFIFLPSQYNWEKRYEGRGWKHGEIPVVIHSLHTLCQFRTAIRGIFFTPLFSSSVDALLSSQFVGLTISRPKDDHPNVLCLQLASHNYQA